MNIKLYPDEKQVIIEPNTINIIYSQKVLSKGTLYNSIISKNPDIEKELKKYCFILCSLAMFSDRIVQDFMNEVNNNMEKEELKDIYERIILKHSEIVKFDI